MCPRFPRAGRMSQGLCAWLPLSADSGTPPGRVWPRFGRQEPQAEAESSQQPAASPCPWLQGQSPGVVLGVGRLPSCGQRAEAAQLPLLCGFRRSALQAPCQHPLEVPELPQVPAGVSCPHPVGLMTAASPGRPASVGLGVTLVPLRLSREAEWGVSGGVPQGSVAPPPSGA